VEGAGAEVSVSDGVEMEAGVDERDTPPPVTELEFYLT
jgi:hypothetical protein